MTARNRPLPPICIKCGQQHVASIGGPGCSGHKKDGSPCRNAPRHEQNVCGFHGGRARQNLHAAENRALEREIAATVERLDGRPVDNPLTELAALAGRARTWMDLMEIRVQRLLSADDAEGGDSSGIRYRGGAGEQLRAEVALYERAMDRLGKFLTDYGRLNIDERLAAITSKQAETVIAAVEAALEAAGVRDKTQITTAKQAAARHLRAVS